ncbi:hypothetical protein LOZ62_000813 [Ophidiomyces ophidiicola]|nr:hypothetical protein LOZ62_000813 [Ophidiomyces ophidiicola]
MSASLSVSTAAAGSAISEKSRQFGAISAPEHGNAGPELQRHSSTRSSKSLERSTSLGDGYTHPRVDQDQLRQSDDEVPQQDVSADSQTDFVVAWDQTGDPENPRNIPYARKWLIVIIMAMGSGCVTSASSIYTMTYPQLTKEFGVSKLVATVGLSTFIVGLGTGPLFLAPLSEWVISLTGISLRHQLAAPMMVYTASPFMGPEIGPLIGGFICQYTTWRWVFYVLLLWAGAIGIAIVLFVPETYHPVLLRRKATRLRKETGDDRWFAPIEKLDRSLVQTVLRSIYRPMLLLIFEPMCLNLCIFSAILLGILYLFFGAFQLVFSSVYGFNLWQVGLSFMGLLVGMAIAVASDPLWRRNYARLVRKREQAAGKPEFEPEWRLPPAIVGAPLVTIGLFIFAWTIFPHVHWIAPMIGSLVFGAGTILVYSGIFTFLVESYPLYAASALAANSFLRSSFAGSFPLFGIQTVIPDALHVAYDLRLLRVEKDSVSLDETGYVHHLPSF